MRPDLSRRLRRAVWRQRLRSFGPALAFVLICAVLGGYLFSLRLDRADPTVSLTQHNGTVLDAHRVAGRPAIFTAQVRLDDGQKVSADSTLATVLKPNERVLLSQARHASGKVSYHVLQVLN